MGELVLRILLASAARAIPARDRDWLTAMLAEADYAESGARMTWIGGCLIAALTMRARESAFGLALAILTAGLIVMDWNTAKDIATLDVLIAVTAGLAYMRPKRTLLIASIVGLCLLVAHSLADVTGILWPFYQCKPLAPADFAILALLLFPAFAGAKAGAALRSALD